MGLEALATNVPGLIRFGSAQKPWETVVERSAQQVLQGLSTAVTEGGDLNGALSKAQLVELGRILFTQLAETPEMIAGDGEEIGALVKAVAEAIAADENLLMTGDDWLKIAAAAAHEAGRNPHRLFGPDVAGHSIAAKALGELLTAAGDALTLGRAGGNVLFGETLRIGIETGLAALSDNASAGAALLSQEGRIRDLANEISVIVVEANGGRFRYGAKEWLALWRRRLPELLASGGRLPALAEVARPDAASPRLTGTITPAGDDLIKTVLLDSPR